MCVRSGRLPPRDLVSRKVPSYVRMEAVLVLITHRDADITEDNPVPFDRTYLVQVYDKGAVNPHELSAGQLVLHGFHGGKGKY